MSIILLFTMACVTKSHEQQGSKTGSTGRNGQPPINLARFARGEGRQLVASPRFPHTNIGRDRDDQTAVDDRRRHVRDCERKRHCRLACRRGEDGQEGRQEGNEEGRRQEEGRQEGDEEGRRQEGREKEVSFFIRRKRQGLSLPFLFK